MGGPPIADTMSRDLGYAGNKPALHAAIDADAVTRSPSGAFAREYCL